MAKKKKETKKKIPETKNNIKPGFIKTGKELLFSPIKLSSNSYQFQERTHSLNQIDKWVFNKITEKILEDGGLEQFISFDETPDGGCFQNELLTWIINENKSNELFEAPNLMGRKFNKNELKKLNDWFEECEGGYSPTLIVDSENEEDYSLAEQGESIIDNYETNGVIYAAGFAAENNMDLDLIYEAWNANGWEDEINALKLFSQKK
jgi:hypothetical protein|tara:strand:+ start:715 stop:1335 length:621 start_codon:yes stop_codon:yes gene_type:complete